MERLQEQMAFIMEIDKLKNIVRRTKLIYADRNENDAEHSWHLAVMAMNLVEYANEPDLDIGKVMQMVLIHDIVEIDAGDTYAYDVSGHADKYERERQAAERIFGLLPADQKQAYVDLWQEFEGGISAEAKFASALDRLQPLIHNYKNQGSIWAANGITSTQVRERSNKIREGSEALWRYAQEIIDQSIAQGFLPE
nr:HD domain-containing protein [Paenibacillus guangzhouensis]